MKEGFAAQCPHRVLPDCSAEQMSPTASYWTRTLALILVLITGLWVFWSVHFLPFAKEFCLVRQVTHTRHLETKTLVTADVTALVHRLHNASQAALDKLMDSK